jgi:hypothetical protein
MMGKNHLIAGTAAAGATGFLVMTLTDQASGAAVLLNEKLSWLIHLWPEWLGGFSSAGRASVPSWSVLPASDLAGLVAAWVMPVELLSAWGIAYAVIAVLLFWVGSLLPDIDSKGSILGRHVHVPGPHHGITHTDWFLTALLLASLSGFTRVLFWLWLGAVLHCWMDGLSQSGRVRFYPLSKYKTIALPNGGGACVVSAGRHFGLYQVGQISESVMLVGILGLSAVSVIWVVLL